VAYSAGLENQLGRKTLGGSNPPPSELNKLDLFVLFDLLLIYGNKNRFANFGVEGWSAEAGILKTRLLRRLLLAMAFNFEICILNFEIFSNLPAMSPGL
jgi:hypothetical protein